MTTPRYQIVYDTGIDALAEKVNNHMREGWTPLGGVAVAPHFFYQAMTKPTLTSVAAVEHVEPDSERITQYIKQQRARGWKLRKGPHGPELYYPDNGNPKPDTKEQKPPKKKGPKK